MAAPNPLWGIHLAPGAITAVLVQRTEDGAYQLLDELRDVAPDDDAALVEAGLRVVTRPELRGRAGMLAIPDLNGSLVTAVIPSEELYLTDDEIQRELHDFTPFEPGEGHLMFTGIGRPADREFLVSALPIDEVRARIATLAELDPAFHGAMTAGPAVVRGARSLGLIGETGFVVDVQSALTAIYALDGRRVRRYLLAVGTDAGGAENLLGRDVLATITYHHDQQRRDDDPPEESAPTGDVVLVGPGAARARAMIAATLGARLAAPAARATSGSAVTGAGGTAVPDDVALRIAPALGAALEAFQGPGARITLREPPDDVPEYVAQSGGSRTPVIAGALVVVLAAAGALAFLGDDPPETRTVEVEKEGPAVVVPDPPVARDDEAAAVLVDSLRRRGALVAALRGVAAVVRVDEPALVGRSVTVEAAREAYRVVLDVTVPGGVTPEARRAARAAIESVPGVRGLTLDTPPGVLRIRFAAGYARLEDTDDGEPATLARLEDLSAATSFFAEDWSALGTSTADGSAAVMLRAPAGRVLEALAALCREAIAAPPERLVLQATPEGDVEIRAELGTVEVGRHRLLPAEAELATAALDACAAGAADLAAGGGRFGSGETPAPSAVLEVVGTGDGWVALAFPAADVPRTLRRRKLDSKTSEVAAEVPAEADRIRDDIPGPPGEYEWSLDGDEALVRARVATQVEIELLGGTTEAARFRLRRSYRQATVATEVTIASQQALEGALDQAGTSIALTTPWTVTGLRIVEGTEVVEAPVPRFAPDGSVVRDDEGRPVVEVRSIERPVRSLEVQARDPAGATRQWLGKMTDG